MKTRTPNSIYQDYDAELGAYTPRDKAKERREAHVRYAFVLLILLGIVLIHLACGTDPVGAFDGTASWYSEASCKREGTSGVWTASGERFYDDGLTCAMPDRAMFGKYVKVTNLANGKSVVVKVNDYGPNKKLVKQGRVIDLSKGAFLRIASLRSGLIKVSVEVL